MPRTYVLCQLVISIELFLNLIIVKVIQIKVSATKIKRLTLCNKEVQLEFRNLQKSENEIYIILNLKRLSLVIMVQHQT